ncbi:unnamed protein product [Pleuronectes platessa]|uniref:Uncharacterized protein n=1 Tax=Pleuronectes platessa TaxID=8262 RepID=A0A9N7YDJ6_PLEPL|nr:unnamed protein product [Pleuronectes platessa]
MAVRHSLYASRGESCPGFAPDSTSTPEMPLNGADCHVCLLGWEVGGPGSRVTRCNTEKVLIGPFCLAVSLRVAGEEWAGDRADRQEPDEKPYCLHRQKRRTQTVSADMEGHQ